MSGETSGESGWFVQCGNCNGKGWVRNAAIVRDRTCEQCENCGTDPDDVPCVIDSLVSHELGWCGCGNPERVDALMLTYLAWRVAWFDAPYEHAPASPFDEDVTMLLAYIADSLDWTEHGGSVGGAWLTDAGHEALANLTAAAGGRRRPDLTVGVTFTPQEEA